MQRIIRIAFNSTFRFVVLGLGKYSLKAFFLAAVELKA